LSSSGKSFIGNPLSPKGACDSGAVLLDTPLVLLLLAVDAELLVESVAKEGLMTTILNVKVEKSMPSERITPI
jgi:hypothetical protein